MKRLLNLNPHAKAAILLLVIALAASFKIMITPGFITHGDITPPLYLERVLNLFYPMWNVHGSGSSLQYLNNLMWGSPFMALSALLHLSPAALIKIYLVSTLFLAGFFMYYAANKLLREVRPDTSKSVLFVASIIPALVYMFCPWAIETITHLAHLWSYALAPLILLAFMKSLQSKKLTYAIGTAFLCALALLGTTWVFFIPILLLSWLVYSLMLSRHDKGEILSHLKVSSLVAVFYVAFSAYWLLPLLLSSFSNALGPTSALTYEALEFINRNSTLINVIRLRGVWWLGLPGDPGSMPSISWLQAPWLLAGFLIPLSAFAALLLKPRSKYVVYFSLMSLVFLFLGMGTQSPFPSVYQWLVFDAPLVSRFGWVFRESYRWIGLVAMTFSFLMAITILEVSCWLLPLMSKARSKASYMALPLILVLFVSSFALYAAPTTYGWLWGTLVPVEVPRERYQIDEWLLRQGEGFSIMWFPKYGTEGTTWAPDKLVALLDNASSPVPAKGAGEPSLATYRDYIYSHSLLNDETAYFGKFLDILNVRYLIFHDDVLGMEEEADTALANLASQNDLELVRQDGFIYVFENEDYAPQVFIPSQNLLLTGGLDRFTSLNAVEDFDPAQAGLIFLQAAGYNRDYIYLSDGIILENNMTDLALPLDRGVVIAPYEYARHSNPALAWAQAGILDRLHGEWHPYLEMWGIENWDLDYGEGIVFTELPHFLVMPFRVAETGSYELWVRYFQSMAGGEIRVRLDSNPEEVMNTRDQITGFVWRKAGTFNLNRGEHTITLENTWAFNAVNLFALIPEGESSEEAIDGLLEDKRVIYILEAELDLYSQGDVYSPRYGGEASNGEVLRLGAGSRAWQEMEVVKEGYYRMAIRLEGHALITIDDQSFEVSSEELDFAYLAPIHLDKGEHTIQIQPLSDDGYQSSYIDVVWLYSTEAEDETLADLFSPAEAPARVVNYEKISDTRYRVMVEASQPFMLALTEAHDSLWVARVNGGEYESQPLYSVINGFWIDQTGELEIIVEYKPQRWFFYGAGITVVSLLGALGYVTWDWRRRKRGPSPGK